MIEIKFIYKIKNTTFSEQIFTKYSRKNKTIKDIKSMYDNIKILSIRRVGA